MIRLARPVWTGTLAFRELVIPVTLHVAQDRQEIKLKTLHRVCGNPISQKKLCQHCNVDVATADTIKGHEISAGNYVPLDATDLDVAASSQLRIERFVAAVDVSPLHLDRSYHVQPTDDPAAVRAYAVLTAALERTEAAALGELVLYGKHNAVLIQPAGGALIVSTLFLAADLRPSPVDPVDAAEKDVRLAAKMIRDNRGTYDTTIVAGDHLNQLRQTIEAKAAAGELLVAPGAAKVTTDLGAALRATAKKRTRPKKPAATR